MQDPRAYRFRDPMDAFDRSYERVQGFQQDDASRSAGNALKRGDYGAASGALYDAGMLREGMTLDATAARQREGAATAQKNAQDDQAKFLVDGAGRLRQLWTSAAKMPEPERKAHLLRGFDQLAGRLRELKEPEEEIAEARRQLEADPETTLTMLGAGAAKAAGYELRSVGDEVVAIDPVTLQEKGRWRSSRPIELDPTKDAFTPETGVPAPQGPAQASTPQAAKAPANIDAIWDAAKQQESGGRGDAIGPKTAYGQAEGSTQMLPATAEAMARKLGIAWNPAYMRENSPKALAYQDKLGRAYFEEGLEKYGGDPEKALAYYHGGPDERIWGPKTKAHVKAVMSRVQPYEVAAVGDTPAPPGYKLLRRGQPKAKEMARPATAAEKAAYGISPETPAQMKPDGSIDVISTTKDAAKVTEGERTAGFLSSRLADSLKNLTSLNEASPAAGKPGIGEVAAGAIPWTNGKAVNLARSAERQQVIANQLDILDAALTLGTGAAYTREQLENYRETYFPVLTDKDSTVTAKRQKLIALLTAAKIKAGAAAPPELDAAIAAAKVQFGAKAEAAPAKRPPLTSFQK